MMLKFKCIEFHKVETYLVINGLESRNCYRYIAIDVKAKIIQYTLNK